MNDRFNLTDKVALVTGAAGGLGAYFALTLRLAGAAVVLAGRRIQPLQQLAQQLQERQVRALPVALDVTDPHSIHTALELAQAQFGIIDIAVCNAGVAVNKKALALTVEDWSGVVDVNLKGSWLVGAEIARRLIQAQQPGSIINVTSILGHRVAGNVLPYAASKAGLEQMTRALALIKRIPQRRLGQASDLDGALLLLASDACLYMTGSSIVVDGGHLQSTL